MMQSHDIVAKVWGAYDASEAVRQQAVQIVDELSACLERVSAFKRKMAERERAE